MPQKRSENLAVVVPFERHRPPSGRQSFERQLEFCLAMAKQTGRRLSVLCIRIDGDDDRFDEIGHETLAKFFEGLLVSPSDFGDSSDLVGRPWSDGLAIIHSRKQDTLEIHSYAMRLLARLERMMRGSGKDLKVDLSIGIALYPNDGGMTSSLLDRAYAAAKRAGRWGDSGFCFASRSVGRQVAHRLSTDFALLQTFEADAARMRFQPVFDLRKSCIIGLNALSSWRHPTLGDRDLEETIDMLGRSEIAGIYNTWLCGRICQQCGQWCRRHHGRWIGIKVNRSQVVVGHMATQLSTALKVHDNMADLIEVAIDGTQLADETDHRLRAGLRQLVELGVGLTLTNIGARSLSMDVLKSLPVQTVEFAAEMTSVIGRCDASERMLAALMAMVSELGLKTRVPGVQSKEQLAYLTNNDCDEAVGPFLAPPMRGDDIDKLDTTQARLDRLNLQALSNERLPPIH